MFLLAGGDSDPQIMRLLRRAALHGIPVQCLLTGQSGTPKLRWDIVQHQLFDGSQEIQAKAAFIRQDVFSYLQTQQAQDRSNAREWFVSLAGWLLSSPEIKVFNRPYLSHGPVNKAYVLRLALELGLEVAPSYVSNDMEHMNHCAEQAEWITKPVSGGAHCQALEVQREHSGAGILSYPQIMQARLEQPELRLFRIGTKWFAFNVISDALDYRASSKTRIQVTDVPDNLREKMTVLSDRLNLNFAAADFKTDPQSKTLHFLEINTNPMFAGFDQAVDGALCDALLFELINPAELSH